MSNPFKIPIGSRSEEQKVKAIAEILVAKYQDYSDLELALDELVHDEKSREASSINNGGYKDQLAYLLSRGWTLEELEDQIDDIH